MYEFPLPCVFYVFHYARLSVVVVVSCKVGPLSHAVIICRLLLRLFRLRLRLRSSRGENNEHQVHKKSTGMWQEEGRTGKGDNRAASEDI